MLTRLTSRVRRLEKRKQLGKAEPYTAETEDGTVTATQPFGQGSGSWIIYYDSLKVDRDDALAAVLPRLPHTPGTSRFPHRAQPPKSGCINTPGSSQTTSDKN